MTFLRDLVEAASIANNGRSMQAAAELATKRGAPISRSHISKSVREIDTLTPQIILGLSAGYDVPEEDVARAALMDMGFQLPDFQTSPESAIRRDPTLSSEARAMLLAAIEAARSSTKTRGVQRGVESKAQSAASAASNQSKKTGLVDDAEARLLDDIDRGMETGSVTVQDADDGH